MPARGGLPVVPECVHCGFCLPVCPTYEALGTEMDSPRGRLHLMRALEDGRVEPTAAVVKHLDLCLGCRACETECPSGVPFGRKLEEARHRLQGSGRRPWGERIVQGALLRAVSLAPPLQAAGATVLRVARSLGAARLAAGPVASAILPRRVSAAARLITSRPLENVRIPGLTPARGKRRMRVGLLTGCVHRWMFGSVNRATVRLLAVAGCEVVVPPGQVCCGALHAHAGDRTGARRLVRKNVSAFGNPRDLDAIVVNAAGCGSSMKDAASLFDDGEARERAARFAGKVRDALELLSELGLPPPPRPVRMKLAYHDACHLAHAQRIREQPRSLLSGLPGVEMMPLTDADRCCGSAGIYNLIHPDAAGQILRAKLERIRMSGADVVAAANPGCILQMEAGARAAELPVRVVHPLEILDEAYGNG